MTAALTSDADSSSASWSDRPGVILALCAAVYAPFTLLGFGTDIDVPNVLRSGRSFVDHGHYEMSRGPGAVVHEVATGVLERIGGSVLVDLSGVAFALLCLWCVHELLRADGARWPTGAVLVLAVNPWFWIAATSLGDYTWALGLVLAGALTSQRRHPVLAGVLFALAVGCRASSGFLALAWLFAQHSGPPEERPPHKATLQTAVVLVGLGLLCFVPPWLAADRTADFLDNKLAFEGFGNHLGRWATKNAAVVGVAAGAVLLVGVRRLLDGVRRWSTSVVVRFAVTAVVVTEVLFFRLPFKPVHLLPAVAAAALLVGASTASRRWVAALVVAQLIGGLVGTTVAAPDVIDDASSGRLDLGLTAGPLLTDVRCRIDDRDRGPWVQVGSIDAAERAGENARCSAASWRAEP